ncbi:hypothetical protein [Georgenia faecalis]|uniref:SRPBCC family protein n=1 Tax=Georgenia faecalis TaxID=2483799 RepID=A0ABV9D5K3_9MICO|nr:hypothetical protein [Georgenia faecalis]
MDRVLPLPADEAFALVTDFARHGEWIPLTRMSVPAGGARPGDAVVARSAVVLLDRMTLERLDPPSVVPGAGGPGGATAGGATACGVGRAPRTNPADGVAVLRKDGPVLLGSATVVVTPVGTRAARVRWTEDVWLRGPLPRRVTRAVLAPLLDAMVGLALWRMDRSLRR